jgi:CDP-paratose 2-epimerase
MLLWITSSRSIENWHSIGEKTLKAIITGVAGFIGLHAAIRFLSQGMTVVGLDNLSRRGSTENLAWVESNSGDFHFVCADIRNAEDVTSLFAAHQDTDVVLHLAAQVAVTTSVANPRQDFEINALGTFNLLEATRQYCPQAVFLYASTNKVYGGMDSVEVVERNGRYAYRNRDQGIGEEFPLDFHSPYGCSKGAADQYVRDYARIYGLKSVVFRQSCIYGTHQFGVEDQGWVAWFTIATALGKPITIYGDGKQIRDLLWVDDLIDLYMRSIERIDLAAGQVYNVGGGPGNTLSLLELVLMLNTATGQEINPAIADWRPGDQRVFVADIRKAKSELGWSPCIRPQEGVKRLLDWTRASEDLLRTIVD